MGRAESKRADSSAKDVEIFVDEKSAVLLCVQPLHSQVEL